MLIIDSCSHANLLPSLTGQSPPETGVSVHCPGNSWGGRMRRGSAGRHVPRPPKKIGKNISGNYHEKFEHFSKLTELLRLCRGMIDFKKRFKFRVAGGM